MKKITILILGIVYYFSIQISIYDVKETDPSLGIYSFILKTPISQNVQLHIGTDKFKLLSLVCGKEKMNFNNKKNLWFENKAGEESATFHIARGEELCYARVRNKGKLYTPIIKQKYTYIDYMILFILLGFPIISWIFTLFTHQLDILKTKFLFRSLPAISYEKNKSKLYTLLIYTILLLGISIRILFFQKYSVFQFQHDWNGHMEFINYLTIHWELPLPSKGLQFPQQPLYYFICAGLFKLSHIININVIKVLGYFSLFCSIAFLYYGYRFFTLITKDTWVIIVATLFISFTPSLIYMSARVNNDVLVMALSASSLYFITRSYLHHFTKYFYAALLSTNLLFITKISAAPLELLFFMLLVTCYLSQKNTVQIKKQLFIFSLIGLCLLGFTLFRVYLPIENTFHFVNSSGGFRNQNIPSLSFTFFIHLNLEQLFTVEYIHSYMKDTSLYTFLNHQYRTMLIGEFNYRSYLDKIDDFKIVIWLLFSFGLIYILGLFSYFHYLWKTKGIHRILFITFLLNLILILKFVFTYPSICNTDFRYFVPSFLIIGYLFAQGIAHFSYSRWIKYLVSAILTLLTLCQIWFLSLVIL